MSKSALPVIKFGQLWNCCPGKETFVITLFEDDGVTPVYYAVCTACASGYLAGNGAVKDGVQLVRRITEDELAAGRAVRDPREVGGIYYNGYWHEHYIVLAIREVDSTKEFTVLWLGSDGSGIGHEVTTHTTPWYLGRDRILSINMLECLDEGATGSYESYEEFISVALDCIDTSSQTN